MLQIGEPLVRALWEQLAVVLGLVLFPVGVRKYPNKSNGKGKTVHLAQGSRLQSIIAEKRQQELEVGVTLQPQSRAE